MTGSAERICAASQSIFGILPDGRSVIAVTLSNDHNVAATVIAYGAALQSMMLPDRTGCRADVVLAYDNLEQYLEQPQYFGATVGRFANRLAGGKFTLDGETYYAALNDGPNSLHGGVRGFDKVLWDITSVASGLTAASVTLRHVSPDGDQGYPGRLTVDATYSLSANDALTIEYRAVTDQPTIVNITNHSYWNLSGEGSPAGAMGHIVTIPASVFLPTDATAIPTGEYRPVEGTALDFRMPRVIGDRVRDEQLALSKGYDFNWVINEQTSSDEHLMACVNDPASGREFELWSNQPGLQMYSGNFLDATSYGKSRRLYRQGDALVLEPQLFPDTPNHPDFGSARLAPGQQYRNTMTYRFKSR